MDRKLQLLIEIRERSITNTWMLYRDGTFYRTDRYKRQLAVGTHLKSLLSEMVRDGLLRILGFRVQLTKKGEQEIEIRGR